MRLSCRLICAAILAFVALPAPASAVTVDQVVALSKAGVSENVILALIDRDQTVLTIEPEQIIELKRQGLSDALVTAMLKSGRAEGDDAARATSTYITNSILSGLAPAPEVTVIGHGPDVPNTRHPDGFWKDNLVPAPGVYSSAPRTPRYFPPYSRKAEAVRPKIMCVATSTTSPSPTGPTWSYVTECPASMQRR
jgi:hypothetical protein